MLKTIAGSITGESGLLPGANDLSEKDEIPGLQARLNYPTGIALDEEAFTGGTRSSNENNFDLYVTDQKNHRLVRLRCPNNNATTESSTACADEYLMSTLIGNHDLDNDGVPVKSKPKGHDGSRAKECDLLNHPAHLVIRNLKEKQGGGKMVYFTDKDNHRICRLSLNKDGFFDVNTPKGFATIAGSVESEKGLQNGTCGEVIRFQNPMGIAMDSSGDDLTFYVADISNHAVRVIKLTEESDSGGMIQKLQCDSLFGGVSGCQDGSFDDAKIHYPLNLALDQKARLLFVADFANNRVIKIDIDAKSVTTLAGSSEGESGCKEGKGSSARFAMPTSVACDGNGNVYVTDWSNHRVCRIQSDGTVKTVVGSSDGELGCGDGPANTALLNNPGAVVVAPSGRTLFIADTGNNRICKVDFAK